MMAREEVMRARIHPQHCACPACSPGPSARRIWIAASIIAFGGSLAMTVDLAGLTPMLARLLGMMP